MNWIESIKEIRKAKENNQLIIFVGAGVSKNSRVPTWSGLITAIAKEIKYDRCPSCKIPVCHKSKCKERYTFTQDEFLRIPEYFYQKVSSKNKKKYYNLIKKTLKSNINSNAIDDEIFNVLPHHIITTNYDSLLENSSNINSQLYTVVSQDSDLLAKSSERYIIKMHGDLEAPDTIVLKESDYIDYEQKHPLISTFIRSLLVNHTFVFLGYSLNDYTLNLIIGWINYFSKIYGVKERPHNFLLDSKEISEFERLRLENKNINIINLTSLPKNLIEKSSVLKSLSDSEGELLYSYLKCITNTRIFQNYISLSEILTEKYRLLRSYKKISYEDLIRVQPLGRTEFAGTVLVFFEKEWYINISKLIEEGNNEVICAFQKAGITAIYFNDNSKIDLPAPTYTEDEVLKLYLDNNYMKLFEYLHFCSDKDIKIYYFRMLGQSDQDIEALIKEEAEIIPKSDYIAVLLHKMRSRVATISLMDRQEEKTKEIHSLFNTVLVRDTLSVGYLKMLFDSTSNNRFKMVQILEKQEELYKNRNTFYSGHSYTHIWALQAYAYDYYFFFKINAIPFDYFSDPNDYFCYYIKAIICSYSPIVPTQQNDLNLTTDLSHYPLNEIDLDILIKYTKSKSIKSWFKEYSVQFLEIDSGIDIVSKYKNLCKSFVRFKLIYWVDQLFCFSICICLLKIDNECKIAILSAFERMFFEVTQKNPRIGEMLFESVDYLLEHLVIKDANDIKSDLLETILNPDVYDVIKETKEPMLSRVLKRLAPYATTQTKHRLVNEIEAIQDKNKKINKIIFLRHILPIEKYKTYLQDNLESIQTENIYYLILEKTLPYSESALNRFVETISREDKKKKNDPGIQSYPDWLITTIDECIILYLIDYDIDLTKLLPYEHYSEHLQFMLHPNDFDYTCIDTGNYMWGNLIYSQKYQEYFKAHKDELLSDNLKNIFRMGVETRDQQKIVYGILLDNDDLNHF